MKISGFTFLKNAQKLYYPVKESILSILDLVDEFVIALDNTDHEDNSLALLQEINSPKIKIIYTKWDLDTYKGGSIYAQQTDLAKEHCTGNWLFYLQGDEVIHEEDINEIKTNCQKHLNNPNVEGFVFNYLHFWGDYGHYFSDHCWYKKEIRIIRNKPQIHSWRDAQSFRCIPDFDGVNYFQKENTRKLNCVLINARVFHYGWVRPPAVMNKKHEVGLKNYSQKIGQEYKDNFDYGRLDYCYKFRNSHPVVMKKRIQEHNWNELLRFSGPQVIGRKKMKHEKTKYRVINWVEKNLLNGYVIGGFKNYTIIK